MNGRLLSLALRDLRAGSRGLWVLCACLALGVALMAASAGLHRQVAGTLLADTRALFGGDLEVRSRAPLSPEVVGWLQRRGTVSLLTELRTMLQTEDARVQLVELQVTDDSYPLYGEVVLAPRAALAAVLARSDGEWGAAFDPTLSRRLGLEVGDRIRIGNLSLRLRARMDRQPDRSLRADWRGPPLMIAAEALQASGLVRPGSRVAYRYRMRTGEPVDALISDLAVAFPDAEFEVRSVARRGERMSKVLDQVGSALVLVALSALIIGGLGVFNSVHAYLQGKLATIAILRALGLRDGRLVALFLIQVLLLAALASGAGALAGGGLALAGTALAAQRLPLAPELGGVLLPMAQAVAFGLLTALTFTLPALGRALSVSTASLFRGLDGSRTHTPSGWWWATGTSALLTAVLVVLAMPEPRFGTGFLLVVLVVLALLEGLVRGLRRVAGSLMGRSWLSGHFAVRLALASLYRPGSPLRALLLSLGTALTLLVACTLVVGALLRTIQETLPEQAPTLVFYDIAAPQVDEFRALMRTAARLDVAPLVLGRLEAVNGLPLAASDDPRRALEARDEHKMSYKQGNFDSVVVERGAWWPEPHDGTPLVAMEDHEADHLGLQVGDRLRFHILGRSVEVRLAAIYGQRRFQARFWLEAIFSDGVLDPFITRYVAAAHMGDEAGFEAQARVAAAMPNVVSVHTASILREAKDVLARASSGLAVVAGVTLLASLLVLVSVVAGSRVHQVYDATVLHAIGARVQAIRRSLWLEYALLAALSSVFSLVLGGAIAAAFLSLRLELEGGAAWGAGIAVAVVVSRLSLGLGARWMLAQLRLSPAVLLRAT